MIQIFLRTTKVTKEEWGKSYDRILEIVNRFPLMLERIESYDGFSENIDKIHCDLIENKEENNECVAFWSDQLSYTAGFTVRFYKDWEVEKEKGLFESEKEPHKPITWHKPMIFDFSGNAPEANGAKLFKYYIDTKALYKYAVLAIGIMLENTLPGRAFVIALDTKKSEIYHTKNWLEYIFSESFDLPVYFNKKRLLESFEEHYNNEVDLVGRLDCLYPKQFKENMQFALQHIGYKPTLEYYANVLTNTHWGTFGFSDVLSPWIDVTKDLEKTLELISLSRQILLSDNKNEYRVKEAQKYDYSKILKDLLNQYILWTPEQRKYLESFYNNKESLERGSEDLFGSIMRIAGYRIDICPIYVSSEYLFNSFMYHNPQKGKEYKEIIENWIDLNKYKYDNLIKSLLEVLNNIKEDEGNEIRNKNEIEELTLMNKREEFVMQYAKEERFFVNEALIANPYFLDKEEIIEELQKEMFRFCKNNKKDIEIHREKDRSEKLKILKYWIKKKQLSVSTEFNKIVEEEVEEDVLVQLGVLASLKVYESKQSYARHLILLNKKHWVVWYKNEKFSLDRIF